ncbi:MAG: hypothetical protein EBU90_01380 [Proteobacteria bacterium]|nr:hypothetical protein [Pseudomonadota bacterium]NBP12812.1 hypothetical protein [bacterium]
MKLLSVSVDAKTVKSEKFGYLTGILYLAPSDESGVINTCPNASEGCRAACLYSAGRGAFESVKKARMNKTIWFKRDREGFMDQLDKDITALVKKANKENMIPCVRLNGTSDLPWENIRFKDGKNIMERHSSIQFYDYTKSSKRIGLFLDKKLPSNYHLTFSRSESNAKVAKSLFDKGATVAIVYYSVPVHAKVVNGDDSDLRFLDPSNSIIALKAKGKAKKDQSGFVVKV